MENYHIIDSTQDDMASLSVVMPSILDDVGVLLKNADLFFRYIPIRNIYVVSPDNVREKITSLKESRLIFVNENEFCDVKRIRELYSLRTSANLGHFGWYVQQFIKMEFSRFTHDNYYLIWDSDTIPLKFVNMFADDGKPYFDMKTEYYPAYFDTINRILPGITKAVNKSFISEHMIIRSEYMREMILEIEALSCLEGDNFQEKIINAIDADDLSKSGFSEFETYGNYILARHEGSYILRDWHSLRQGGRFYSDVSQIDDQTSCWLSSKYDAISLEKWHNPSIFAKIVCSRFFQKIFPPEILDSVIFRRF